MPLVRRPSRVGGRWDRKPPFGPLTMQVLETDPRAPQGIRADPADRYAVVCARFNAPLTEALLQGCQARFDQAGLPGDNLTLVRVPGAFEIPATAQALADTGRFAAIVCLGAVVRGATPHFDYVAGECARGIAAVSRQSGLPVIFGVITTDTWAQAEDRARPGLADNKGADAAAAAIEMVAVFRKIRGLSGAAAAVGTAGSDSRRSEKKKAPK